MNSADSRSFRIALIAGHVAWMIDIVLLPLWVGGLVEGYKYSPAQANSIALSLLISVIAARCLLDLLLHHYSVPWVPAVRVAMASLCFMVIWFASDFLTFLLLHALFLVCRLSVINGAIGRPIKHRTVTLTTTGLDVFSIALICACIEIIAATESHSRLLIFLDIMAAAALVNILLIPHRKSVIVTSECTPADAPSAVGLTDTVWLLALSLLGIIFNQLINFHFREDHQQSRVGPLHNQNRSAICRLIELIAVFMKNLSPFMRAWQK
ncbi:MAG: hypothetical protein VCA57_13275 [Pseudomonas sp.]|uniref:hypothetical protein n=1 Tax=Pseudomonas sp. TaxID=306 RepID=UPI00398207FA